jgi:hypothetical protein
MTHLPGFHALQKIAGTSCLSVGIIVVGSDFLLCHVFVNFIQLVFSLYFKRHLLT